MVPGAGIEPARLAAGILSPLRLPISPPGHGERASSEGRLEGRLRLYAVLKIFACALMCRGTPGAAAVRRPAIVHFLTSYVPR